MKERHLCKVSLASRKEKKVYFIALHSALIQTKILELIQLKWEIASRTTEKYVVWVRAENSFQYTKSKGKYLDYVYSVSEVALK